MFRTKMAPSSGARRAEVEQDFEPDAVVTALEIMKVKVPMPGGADHGADGIAALMESDGSRLENQLVAGNQQPSAQIHILIVGAVVFVVAADTQDCLLAENRAETTKALVRGVLDYNPLKAKVLGHVDGAPGIGRPAVIGFDQTAAGAYDMGVGKVREEVLEPSGVGKDVGVDRPNERMGCICKSSVAGGSETFVFFVTDDAHG